MRKIRLKLVVAAGIACILCGATRPVIVDRLKGQPFGCGEISGRDETQRRFTEAAEARVAATAFGNVSGPSRVVSTDGSLLPGQVVDDGTRINLNVVNWFSGQFLGIGALRPCSGTGIERIFGTGGVPAAPKGTAGIYADGKYYTSTWQSGGGQVLKATFFAYDATTWELIREIELAPQWYSVYDNGAYNPVDGKIYVLGYDGVKRPYLAELDPETGMYTQLVGCVVNIKAMAFDAKGNLYALTKNGEIERIDLTTGLGTPLFRVDDSPEGVNYWQTIAFDYHTGELFWLHTSDTFHATLRRVDIETGKVDIISDLFDLFGATGAWVSSPDAPGKAPATPSSVRTVFANDGLYGDIIISVPDKTFDSTPLHGDVTVRVCVDGNAAGTLSGIPGSEAVLKNYDFGSAGEHTVSVVASNLDGDSPAGKVTVYCGVDTPAPVSQPRLETDGSGLVSLSWEAPSKGIHGGYIDPESITYDITRTPGDIQVAKGIKSTNFIDRLPWELDRYSYIVTPVCNGLRGEEALSNSVVYGPGYPVPLSVGLGEENFFRLSNIFDLDGDGATFYSTWGAVSCNIAFTYVPHTSDDWFITAPVYLEPGNYFYQITYMATTDGVDATFTMGRDNVPEAQTRELASVENLAYADGVRTTWLYVRAETAGNYYFGIHYTPTVPGMTTSLPYGNFKTLRILEGPDDKAPASVEGLSARAYTKGELKTELTFTVPGVAFDGSPLTSVDKVEICDAEDRHIGEVSGLRPGQRATYTDTACTLGINAYHVYVYNDAGRGALAEVEVYVGDDAPGLISGLDYDIEDNRELSFRWTSPSTVGRNGGYVDPAGIVYDFCRSQYSYQEPFAVDGGSNLTSPSFNYTECGADSYFGLTQHTYYYGILPKNNMGNGIMGVVGIVCGAPYQPPYTESFPGGYNQTVVWATQLLDGEPAFSISTGDTATGIMPSDDDSGMLLFKHDNDVKTGQAVISPILELKDMANPVLAFDLWHNAEAESDAYVSVQASRDNGQYRPIGETIAVNDGSGQSGWVRHYIPLADYNNSDRVFIALLGVNSTAKSYFAIDRFSVYDDLDTDLAVTSFEVPSKAWINEKTSFTVEVACRGASDADDYEVMLLAAGVPVAAAKGKPVTSGHSARIQLVTVPDASVVGQTEYEVRIVFPEDANPANDSMSATVNVRGTSLPAPTALTVSRTAEETATLSWNTPEPYEVSPASEDWENAEAFAITDQGEWVFVDNDRLMPCGIGGLTYPNMAEGRAWMVWNPGKVNFTQETWQPHSGSQALIAFASDIYTVDGVFDGTQQSDEWLVSPPVAGDTEVSFWIRATAGGAKERFEFLISYGSRDTEDFTPLGEEVVVSSTEWKCYRYILPADARYFAIRYVSKGQEAFAVLLDDIDYTPGWLGLELEGYNVYLDGHRLNSEPVMGNVYDMAMPQGKSVMKVSALYNEGESEAATVIYESSVAGISEDNVKVTSLHGAVLVEGASSEISLYTTAGYCVESRRPCGHDLFDSLQAGVYIVRTGAYIHKCIVK